MSTVKVTIAGHDYKIHSNESDEYVIALSKTVDKTINDILDGKENMDIIKACVLASLDAFDERAKAVKDLDHIRVQLKEYMDENATLHMQNKRLEQQIAKLEKQSL